MDVEVGREALMKGSPSRINQISKDIALILCSEYGLLDGNADARSFTKPDLVKLLETLVSESTFR